MPLSAPLSVRVAAPTDSRVPKPQLLWPTSPGYGDNGGADSAKFPSLTAIKARKNARLPAPLAAFVKAAWNAQERILVLDDFLFKPLGDQSLQTRCDQILSWLPDSLAANDIRFLTNSVGNQVERDAIQKQFDERAASINRCTPRWAGAVKIEIRFTLGSKFPYVHDRFAIIDNELWHCGATVGGLHNLVNAATRGWVAENHDAKRFFEDAWNGDGDALRGGRHG